MKKKASPFNVRGSGHVCSFCGKEFLWGDASEWYGYYKVHKPGKPDAWEEEKIIAEACSEPCVKAMKKVYQDE